MIAGEITVGQEVRAKVTSASITVMLSVERTARMLDIVPEAPRDDADTSVSESVFCESGETVDMFADSDETAEGSIQLDGPCDESESISCSELEHTIESDCMTSIRELPKHQSMRLQTIVTQVIRAVPALIFLHSQLYHYQEPLSASLVHRLSHLPFSQHTRTRSR
jgi:hypothetical protein